MNKTEQSVYDRNKAIQQFIDWAKERYDFDVKIMISKIQNMCYSVDCMVTTLQVLIWVLIILSVVGGITGLLKWWF